MSNTSHNPTKEQIKMFVEDFFEESEEFEEWIPTDYNPSPSFIGHLEEGDVKNFAIDLVHLWPKLARKIKPEVAFNSEQYSMIFVPNGIIIPGGRFREFYYWDSYWIIKGLLLSEMKETARGMIDNFITMVARYGFVPNGGRIYYVERSQPPLLTKMVDDYVKSTGDIAWLADNIEYLDAELRFWLEKRTVDVDAVDRKYKVAHYNAPTGGPRPESYREDFMTALVKKGMRDKDEIYIDLKSGAESGWDFTSRWFFDSQGGPNASITNIQTRRVAPVDLNAFLCGAFKDISRFYRDLEKPVESIYWEEKAKIWQETMSSLFWNETDGTWYDYDLQLNQHRRFFYASNVAPLWTGCFDSTDAINLGDRTVEYLKENDIPEYPGGIPASTLRSGEQWDYPNCWPPLQAIVVQGLENTRSPAAMQMAEELGKKWVLANLKGYEESGEMFEKYDAEIPGGYGGGGEYVVQSGFGWTNGVALEFIDRYFRKSTEKNRKGKLTLSIL